MAEASGAAPDRGGGGDDAASGINRQSGHGLPNFGGGSEADTIEDRLRVYGLYDGAGVGGPAVPCERSG